MLSYLEIKNYIFIKHLALEFDKGLNIFTGETGAGKSIIIEAISLIAGERISGQVVGSFSDKCELVGVFEIDKEILKELELDFELSEEIIIRREIDAQNRSKCFINDKLVSLSLIKKISELIIDIHGQNEHQKLLSPFYQLLVLDKYSDISELLKEYKNNYYLYKEKLQEKQKIFSELQVTKQKMDFLQYQINEIEQAKLTDEDENIEEEFEKAKNAQKILNICSEIRYNIKEIEQKLYSIEKQIETFKNLSKKTFNFSKESILSFLEDLKNEVANNERIFSSYNTELIDNLLDRVDLIKKLKRKYGNNIKDIKNYYEKIKNELSNIELKEKDVERLDEEIKEIEKKLLSLAVEISGIRKKNSLKLTDEINSEFPSLGLQKARFQINIETFPKEIQNLTSSGLDKIEFLVSTNPGSPFLPLKNIASGGELSRIMLSIKTVLGKKEDTPILIFDEIDAGVSGPVGFSIGKKLKQLSLKDKQIFCITHLPQIASFADKHFYVKKEQKENKTLISVETLSEKQRVEEIARMLSGKKIDETSFNHAEKLIKEANESFK